MAIFRVRKAPRTYKVGAGFAHPEYALSVQWLEARDRIAAAAVRQRDDHKKVRIMKE